MRATPSINGDVIGRLPSDSDVEPTDVIIEYGTNNIWVQLQMGAQPGWTLAQTATRRYLHPIHAEAADMGFIAADAPPPSPSDQAAGTEAPSSTEADAALASAIKGYRAAHTSHSAAERAAALADITRLKEQAPHTHRSLHRDQWMRELVLDVALVAESLPADVLKSVMQSLQSLHHMDPALRRVSQSGPMADQSRGNQMQFMAALRQCMEATVSHLFGTVHRQHCSLEVRV